MSCVVHKRFLIYAVFLNVVSALDVSDKKGVAPMNFREELAEFHTTIYDRNHQGFEQAIVWRVPAPTTQSTRAQANSPRPAIMYFRHVLIVTGFCFLDE